MEEIDLYKTLVLTLKKWKILAVFTILGAVLGLLLSIFVITPQYSATSKVYIRGTSSLSASLSDLQIGTYLSSDYEVIFKSRPVIEQTIKDLNADTDYEALSKAITVKTITDTRILSVSCVSNNAEYSKDVVNTLVKNAINEVNEIDAKTPYVIEKAVVNNKPVSVSKVKATAIGSATGLFISLCAVMLYVIFNTKVSTAKDLEKLGIPVLGSIPKSNKVNYLRGDKHGKRSV